MTSSFTLNDLQSGFLEALRVERRASAHTIRNYEAALQRFNAFLQSHTESVLNADGLNALKTRDFRAFLAWRHRDGVDPATLRLDLSALRSFFRYWDRRDVLSSAALSALKSPKRRAVLPRPISAPDADALIAASSHGNGDPSWVTARDAALFTLLYGAGLRISEALSLSADGPEGLLRIYGKGGKTRDVPLLPEVSAAIRRYQTARCDAGMAPNDDGDSPLFIGVRGKRLSPSVAQARMRRLRQQLGLPDSATPHALRHAFATELLASGADLRVIQELLGHASLASTQRYTAIDPDRLQREHHRCHPRSRRR
ncbi:MAG: tyrosine-type recombinase/integrase [Pseudomonadota bacterium]